MNGPTITRLQLSFDALRPRAHDLATRFFDSLQRELPALRDALPADPNDRRQRLLSALTLVITNVSTPECIVDPFQALLTHDSPDWVVHDHQETITRLLVESMAAVAGHMWTDQLAQDWTGALTYAGNAPEVFFG
jgi:hemoglobin-like flavoprotein